MSPMTLRPALAALGLAGAVLAGCSPPEDQLAKGRNLVLISLDTLRADRLGAYGYSVQGASPSPRLDALMGSGVRFASASAPRAITWPSLATVLTGLYPRSHGVADNGYQLADDLPTLATILQSEGYRTGRFLSNMCQANPNGWDQTYCSRGVDSKIDPQALEWLESLEEGTPFFLWAHYFGAHSPYYNGGSRAAKRLDPGYEGPVAAKKGWLNRIMLEKIPLDEADLRHLDALYDAAVMGSDRFVGALMDGLQERERLDDTLIVLLSDHGEELYDHNAYIYHACSVYQTGLHVPLAFVAPGVISAGAVVEQSVELLDVSPTVLELLGIETPPSLQGSSLVPYLLDSGTEAAGRPAFSEYGGTRIHTVLSGNWKLVDNPDHESPICLPGATESHYLLAPVELYNLAEDPLEKHNLAEEYPEKVEELRELIRRRFADLPNRWTPQEIPEELKEELEALGYVAN
jgi:arylsulfatase A-like enzyme